MPTKTVEEMRAQIGWTSPAFSVTLEQGRIADFAAAVFDDDPVFTDETAAHARGLAGSPVPVTLFGAVFFKDETIHEPDLGFDRSNALHGGQEFSFERTPLVGETLSGRTELVDVVEKDHGGGGSMVVAEYETEYRDDDGDLVLTATRTRLEVTEA